MAAKKSPRQLRWCIGIRSNLNICPQTECLSHEISEKIEKN